MSVNDSSNSSPPDESAKPHRASLLVRQTVFVAIMIVLTSTVLTVAGFGFARAILYDQVRERMWAEAIGIQRQLQAYVARHNERLVVLARNTELCQLLDLWGNGDIQEDLFNTRCKQILGDTQVALDPLGPAAPLSGGRYLNLALIDFEGNMVVTTDEAFPGGKVDENRAFVQGREEFVMTPPREVKDSLRASLAAPLRTEEGRFFVILASLDANPLLERLTNSTGQANGQCVSLVIPQPEEMLYVVNPSDGKKSKTVAVAERPWLRTATTGKLQFEEVQCSGDEPRFVVGLPLVFQQWGLVTTIPKNAALEPLGRLQMMLLGCALGTLIVAGVLTYGFTFRITRPLMDLVRFAGRMAQGDLDQRSPVESSDEVGTLAQALNGMAEQLESSYGKLEQRVRERTAELQTANEQLTREVNVRRETEHALEHERFLLHTLMDNLPDNIYFKDRESRFLRISRAMARRFGLKSPALALGKTDFDFFTDEHAIQARTDEEALLRSGKPALDVEEEETWPDGHRTWVQTTKMPLHDVNGEVVGTFGISRDVTRRRLAEQALREAKEVADAANRAKSEFVANMSHEIRTPLHGIIGMTELALETELTREQRDYLEAVNTSAETLLLIINDILDFSKIESGKLELDSAEFALRETLDKTLQTLAVRAHGKGLELACFVADDVPDCLVGDAVRCRQIITNLVGNAIKFTEDGEVVLRIEVDKLDAESVTLHATVTDTGIGIPVEKQEAIFQAFTQADTSTTRRFGGTGLGLTISAFLVRQMDGEIWVESQENQGAIFHFSARFDWREPRNLQQWQERLNRVRDTRVLVVDDNATNRRILGQQLEALQVRATLAGGGAEAFDILRDAAGTDDPFRVLITDCHMPDIDGFALTARVRQTVSVADVTILMLTSGGHPGDSQRVDELQIAFYLLKPVGRERLLLALDAALSGRDISGVAAHELQVEQMPQLPRLNVLVAEDGLANQRLVQGVLSKQGHHVVIVQNGEEAVRACRDTRYDMVLMDVQMPILDGLEATRRIRAREKQSGGHVPIVAMTAHAMKGDREKCLAAGMDQYVSKPVRARTLFESIAAALVSGRPMVTPEDREEDVMSDNGIINWQAALESINGDMGLFESVVEAYLEETPQRLADMREALNTHNAEAFERASHTIKSSLQFFGAAQVADQAFQLEMRGKANDLDSARQMLTNFEAELNGVTELLQEFIEQHK